MNILVTGGCGYVGSALVPELLRCGHEVFVMDLLWFGRNLNDHNRLFIADCDIRSVRSMIGYDCVIHLAAVANDPCGELDPKLTWEINALGTEMLIDAAARAGVKQFIYASSGSVYGVKDEPRVTENLRCEPLSEYNKTKMVAERVVMSYSDKMAVQILRPATVCGWSPRTRLDVAVNALTISALSFGEIKVFGGDQIRPNVHITDMVRAYMHMLCRPELTGIYNVGRENYSISAIAELVAGAVGGRVVHMPSNDKRSYRLDSSKLASTGFEYSGNVLAAIDGMARAWESGLLRNTDNGYNLRAMPR